MKTKGFTLVELLVVIAILAILATVSVVGYTSFIERANDSVATTELHQIQSTINSYKIAGQKYVIATLTTGTGTSAVVTEFYVELDTNNQVKVVKDVETTDADGKVTVEQVKLTSTDIATAGFVWADFGSIASKLTVSEAGLLQYNGTVVVIK